jgi:hypothetical protein
MSWKMSINICPFLSGISLQLILYYQFYYKDKIIWCFFKESILKRLRHNIFMNKTTKYKRYNSKYFQLEFA